MGNCCSVSSDQVKFENMPILFQFQVCNTPSVLRQLPQNREISVAILSSYGPPCTSSVCQSYIFLDYMCAPFVQRVNIGTARKQDKFASLKFPPRTD